MFKMIYIDVGLNHVTNGYGDISAIYPEVRIGLNVEDNVDKEKLNLFKEKLALYIDRGLNECLTHDKR